MTDVFFLINFNASDYIDNKHRYTNKMENGMFPVNTYVIIDDFI